jgi:hypothetical protein
MAREIKKVELRPVDDGPVDKRPVLLLKPGSTKVMPEPLVRIDPPSKPEPDTRLEIPQNDGLPHRSHEPGIDELFGQEPVGDYESEADWGENERSRTPLPWGWFVLVGVILLGGVLWSLSHVNMAKEQLEHIKVDTVMRLDEEEAANIDAAKTISRIEQAIRSFHAAASIEELLPLVRHPERVRPLMDDHYGRNPFVVTGEVEIKLFQPLTLGNQADFWMSSVRTDAGVSRNLLLEVTGSGEVLADWETAVCYQPMPWDQYARERPGGTTMDFRVYVSPDVFHSHEFGNSNQWRCYRLTALDSEETLFGYAPAGSETARHLEQLFLRPDSPQVSMILRLRLPAGLNSRRGVVIEKVLSNRWLYLEPPGNDS